MNLYSESKCPQFRSSAFSRGRFISLTACFVTLVTTLLPAHLLAQQPEERGITENISGSEQVPDWDGLKSDTWYFLGAQVASLGVLYTLPKAVSNWGEEQKDNYSLSKWRENVSEPHLDGDDFYLNYILHPYWGATYYVRARERGYNKVDSFWYSTFLSTFYEMGPEALFEQPSIQDLLVTPVFGAWLGEYFMGIRNTIRQRSSARGHRTTGENWIWYLTDPLNFLSRGIGRLFGEETSFSFRPFRADRSEVAALTFGRFQESVNPVTRSALPATVSGFSQGHGSGLSSAQAGTDSRFNQARPRSESVERITGISVTLTW